MNFFSSGSKPSRRPVTEDGSLYFAYGSNLHLTQMANRCPASIFKGKAVLPGYRWQINERGVANVVQSIDDSVEGLLYLVNAKDERSLDRSEGVAKGFYQKHLLTVAFEPHRRFENRESFEVAQLIAQPEIAKETAGLQSQGPDGSYLGYATMQEEPKGIKNVKALVYVSENYTSDGIIREEYILRVQKAMADAEILGVSRSFVDKYVTPFLDERNEVLSSPSRARGGGYALKSRGDDSSTKAKSKRMKVIEGYEGQMSAKPRPHYFEGTSDPLDRVDFQGLQHANRVPHADSGLEFPTAMLDTIRSTRPKTTREKYEMTYVVVARKDQVDSTPHFEILATSWDLELANELAIKHFRDACSQFFPSITETTRESWVRSDSAGIQSGAFGWNFDDNACIQLDAAVLGSGRISVQVKAQRISARF
ncbi:hypothetical protein F4859DRAFT_425170 [Xylaria cf. heliscus]|nr:hypothetical protein F4859DRAFT_425170 [Xylaria cf. heliscus]